MKSHSTSPCLLVVVVFLQLLPGTLAAKEPQSGWNWEIKQDKDDLQFVTTHDGQSRFSFQLGAGGAISGITNDPHRKPLLSPSFQGEQTDRIIQWTIWSDTVINEVPKLPKFEWRFNVTQGGCFDGTLSPVMDVIVDRQKNIVDVYAVPQEQWKTEQREAMQCKLSALTRYELSPNGVLKIRRLIRVGNSILNGQPAKFDQLYVEGWTPFLRSADGFDSVATMIERDGRPSQTYQAGPGFPNYPGFKVQTTGGYAVVYNQYSPKEKVAIGVVFGKKQVESKKGGVHQLNLMQWDNGIGVLPAITLHGVEPGSMIEQRLCLVARSGLGEEMQDTISRLAEEIPAPRVIGPSEADTDELKVIAGRLADNAAKAGKRTVHLFPLVQEINQ